MTPVMEQIEREISILRMALGEYTKGEKPWGVAGIAAVLRLNYEINKRQQRLDEIKRKAVK